MTDKFLHEYKDINWPVGNFNGVCKRANGLALREQVIETRNKLERLSQIVYLLAILVLVLIISNLLSWIN